MEWTQDVFGRWVNPVTGEVSYTKPSDTSVDLSGNLANTSLEANSFHPNPDGTWTYITPDNSSYQGKLVAKTLTNDEYLAERERLSKLSDFNPLGMIVGAIGAAAGLPTWAAGAASGGLTSGDLGGAIKGGLLGYAGGQLFGGAEGATSGLNYENSFDTGAMADAMGYTPYSDLKNAATNFGWSDGASAPTDYANELQKAASDYGWSDNASLGGTPNADINGMPTGLLDSLKLDPSKLAKAAMGLLGGSTPTPQQSSPMGGSSGYQANIQPDMGLLSLNKPQYANIFQTQALQPIYGSQRGY